MQNEFYWINEPAEWHSENNTLSVVTDDHTDFWRHTWYGFERFSGHIYATDAAGDFTFQTNIRADFSTLYDQAGIMLMSDEQHWLKAGIEYNDGRAGHWRVLTLQASDWATGIFPGNPREFWASPDPQGRRSCGYSTQQTGFRGLCCVYAISRRGQ